jgi:hypothetical protein
MLVDELPGGGIFVTYFAKIGDNIITYSKNTDNHTVLSSEA